MKKAYTPIHIGIVIIIIIIISLLIIGREEPLSSGYGVSGTVDGITTTELTSRNFLSVTTNECTPDGGFDICQIWTNVNGQATATARIQMSEGLRGVQKGGYYVGDVTIPVRLVGDNFYYYEAKNIKNWNDFWWEADCDQNGCRNFVRKLNSQDTILLAKAGQEYKGCPVIVAHDYSYVEQNTAQGLSWWWSYVYGGRGYLDTQNKGLCWDIKSVACYDDADCSSSQFCNKSGSWNQWSCQTKPVETNCFACQEGKLFFQKIPVSQCTTHQGVLYTNDEASCKVAKPALFTPATQEPTKTTNIFVKIWDWFKGLFGGEK